MAEFERTRRNNHASAPSSLTRVLIDKPAGWAGPQDEAPHRLFPTETLCVPDGDLMLENK